MKKISLAAIVAIAAAAFSSCGNGTPNANLKDDVDTLSYAIGMAQSDGLKPYLQDRLGVDTTEYLDEFIKGVNEGIAAGDDKKKAARMAGIQIGQQISQQMIPGLNREVFGDDSTQTVSLKNFIAGFIAGTTGEKQLMTLLQARGTADTKIQQIKAKTMEKQWGEYKKQNEAWLAANAKKPGVVTLPSGVQYKIITKGSGAVASDTSMVKVHYEGKNIEGKVFDSSYKRNAPAEMRPGQVIKGWTEVLKLMPAGSKWEVYIPASLAYGAQQQGPEIKPFSTLVFTIELLEVK